MKAANHPPHVLFLIDSFQMGGAERITAALLPYLDRNRVTPVVCTLRTRGDSPLARQLGDVRRLDLGAKRMLDLSAFWRLLRVLRDEQIDLIHAQLQDSTILAVAANKLTGIPVVVTRHLIGDDEGTSRKRFRNEIERFTIRAGVRRVITVSDAARDHYARLARLPLTAFKTIYNGIDLGNFKPAKNDLEKKTLRQELGLPTAAPLVTMVGVMRPGKGQEVCIAAARYIHKAQFILVGDGDPAYRATLETQAKNLPDRIHFLGQRMDVARILSASDMLVLPSDSEALPTVLIEAGAAALPVVATRVGGVPEIVGDGLTGILVPPQDPRALANAIQHLLDHPDRARQMGQRAHERIHRQFTISNQAETLTELYESTLAEIRGVADSARLNKSAKIEEPV